MFVFRCGMGFVQMELVFFRVAHVVLYFRICDQKKVENTRLFELLLNCSHKTFSVSHDALEEAGSAPVAGRGQKQDS